MRFPYAAIASAGVMGKLLPSLPLRDAMAPTESLLVRFIAAVLLAGASL